MQILHLTPGHNPIVGKLQVSASSQVWSINGTTLPPLGEIVVCGGSDIYHKTLVAKELLELRPTVTYEVANWSPAGLECQFPGCDGILQDGWMMWQHFRDVHQLDIVKVPKEGKFPWCRRSGCRQT